MWERENLNPVAWRKIAEKSTNRKGEVYEDTHINQSEGAGWRRGEKEEDYYVTYLIKELEQEREGSMGGKGMERGREITIELRDSRWLDH